jgi:ribosome-associated heat shock protein Hsp15
MSPYEAAARGTGGAAARVDRWLFGVRLFKSRSLAAQAVSGGKVRVNDRRVKPAHTLRPGDRLSFVRAEALFECVVAQIPARRGPAPEARHCYQETGASQARRAELAGRMRLASAHPPRPQQRPDKHQRRELRRLRGRG